MCTPPLLTPLTCNSPCISHTHVEKCFITTQQKSTDPPHTYERRAQSIHTPGTAHTYTATSFGSFLNSVTSPGTPLPFTARHAVRA